MTRDFTKLRYWVDDMGALWKGPVAPESTMHYATLDGIGGDDAPCWVIRRSAEPENADEIPPTQAEAIIARYVDEFTRMGDDSQDA